jgi:hypothetical protein
MLQAPRIMSEFRPFLASPVTATSTFVHQSSKIESVGCGASEESPTQCSRGIPERSRKHAPNEEVLNALFFLVA